ncbi:SIS domain-containing protein [Micromonospora peucetia]|uniref:SIS domain-containing protein n=1 Tax=Micromonospora peucetia TaxID=47871 RepID=A0ABZ1E9A2_9ACTN|nr:SIS domain-containing protein [Micromonospora peucetia]MCX4388242.1 SIS domain-containing protein [Micromonospora peucetia]WSA31079.1 SIS domain-containing protein [Micromonospora peucetia]
MPEPAYANIARTALEQILATQLGAIESAATLVADAIAAGAVLQAFGTGHSRIVTLELAARAGGLAPVSMLAVKDLVMFGGADPGPILDPTYERESGLAERIYALAAPATQDPFLIVSNSGINAAIVEMATLARERKHPIIAVTSVAHTRSAGARTTQGPHLADLADVVIDNLAPAGDAALEITPEVRIGAVSSFTGVLIAQLLTELVCRRLLERGIDPPVHTSANLAWGDARNAALQERYRDRVRPIEP